MWLIEIEYATRTLFVGNTYFNASVILHTLLLRKLIQEHGLFHSWWQKNQYSPLINKTTTPLDKLFSVFQSQTLSNLFSSCTYMNKTFGCGTMWDLNLIFLLIRLFFLSIILRYAQSQNLIENLWDGKRSHCIATSWRSCPSPVKTRN